MREIKFRAWHKFCEEIIPVVSINFENQIINSKGPWRFFSEIDLMQSTGLKDKNGVEIYEGDIVNVNLYGGTPRHEEVKIYTNSGYAGVHPFTDTGYQWSSYRCEVIGNIYEHPHLLEETK